MAASILMDARSIAATMRNGGRLIGADMLDVEYKEYEYRYDPEIYRHQVFDFTAKPEPNISVRMGPNIAPWPEIPAPAEHLLLKVAGCYPDSVTTDELLPSGEATSWRSNPEKLAEFTMQSRDPEYTLRAKKINEESLRLRRGERCSEETEKILEILSRDYGYGREKIGLGSLIVSRSIGDGSSREQAPGVLKALGVKAVIAKSFARIFFRNAINIGLPAIVCKDLPDDVQTGDTMELHMSEGTVEANGKTYTCTKLPEYMQGILNQGGLIASLNKEEK